MLRFTFLIAVATWIHDHAATAFNAMHSWFVQTNLLWQHSFVHQQVVTVVTDYGAFGYLYIAGGIFASIVTLCLTLGIIRRTVRYALDICQMAYKLGAGRRYQSHA